MPSVAKLFRIFIIRDVLRHWPGALVTVLGIAIGVGVVLAIHLTTNSALVKFRQSVQAVAGKANLEIRPSAAPYIDESILRDISWITRLGGKYTPLVQASALLTAKTSELVQLVGVDMLSDPDFRTYKEIKDGNGSGTQGEQRNLDSSENRLNEDPSHLAFVGLGLANRHGLKAGSRLDLSVNDRTLQLTVTGVLTGSGLGGAYSGDLVVIDIDTAQSLLDRQDKIDQIEMIIPDNDLEEVREQLTADLPQNLMVTSPLQQGKQVEQMLSSFEFNLNSLSCIALIVGLFLIYNTMTICVIRRRVELGTLRALGLPKWGVMLIFTLEAVMFGVAGSGIGTVLGINLAEWTSSSMASTVQYLYLPFSGHSMSLDWVYISIIFLAGVVLTTLASIPPVLEATSVAPAETTRRSSEEVNAHLFCGRLAFAGLCSLFLAWLAFNQTPQTDQPIFGHLGTLFSMIACALVCPLVCKYIFAPTAFLLGKTLGPEAKIAVRCLYGALGRTSIVIASLMVSIAMMVTITVMLHSFEKTVEVWLDQTFKADLWLRSSVRAGGSKTARLGERIVRQIADIPSVVALSPFVELPIDYKGKPSVLAAADFEVEERYGHLVFINGASTSSVCARVRGNHAVVSEVFARKQNVKEGDELSIPTGGEVLKLRVEGIYCDYSSDQGYIIMPRDLYQQHFHDDAITSCAIYLKPGCDPSIVRAEVLQKIGATTPVLIHTTGELRREAMNMIDRAFVVTNALQAIAIAVAMLTITNALFELTLESRRDFGTLKYLGASKAQLSKIVLVQAGVLGFLGNLWGVVLGLFLASFLIVIVNQQSFGWSVRMDIPGASLLQCSVFLIVTAIVAGILPARQAARTVAPEVLRDE